MTDNIPFGDGPRTELLDELPPLPDWFVEHNQAPLHLDNCATCRRAAAKLDYPAYLRSEGWQIRRQMALDFYDNRCCLCNTNQRLQVHHRTYERIGRESLRDLIVLCDTCHERHHQRAA